MDTNIILVNIFVAILALQVSAQSVHKSPFSMVAEIGFDVSHEVIPSRSCSLSKDERYLYFAGTVETGGKSVQFGKPLRNKLGGQTDLFLSKIDLTDKKPLWTVTEGTSETDAVETLLLHDQDKFIFVAGSTYGNFAGAVPKGLSDIFINKYEVGGTKLPKPVWLKPMMLGSTGMESVTALSSEGNVIYAAGFTTGELFAKSKGGSDAILFTLDSKKGTLLRKVQFGTSSSEEAKALVVGADVITVVVEVDRKISGVDITNLQVYKFNKQLGFLGTVLLETFAKESISRILIHPQIENSILLVGTSKLDDTEREDLLFRRVKFDVANATKIGNIKLRTEDIIPPAFISRISGTKQTVQYGNAAGIHDSGRVVAIGFTTGIFGTGAGSGIMEPYIATLDARDGSKEQVLQKGGSKQDWLEAQAGVVTKSKVHWIGKGVNNRLNSFYSYVGTFEIPRDWMSNIDFSVQKRPVPKIQSKSTNNTESKGPLGLSTITWIYIGSGIGGGVALIAIIVVCCCCLNKFQSK